MQHINLDYITIGDRRYAIELLNPLEAIELGFRAISQFGPFLGECISKGDMSELAAVIDGELDSASLHTLHNTLGPLLRAFNTLDSKTATDMFQEAIARCYTPGNDALRDDTIFNQWFQRFPRDMYLLGIKALHRLLRDFFMNPLATNASGLNVNAKESSTMTASQ